MVAREIAEHLVRKAEDDDDLSDFIKSVGGLDIAACEAAGLAHDLGHPPFGHVGEATLNRLLQDKARVKEGFEGNAQSFRIVTKLDRHGSVRGLNLTNVTLAAVLKYPWPYSKRPAGNHKFNVYESEGPAFGLVRKAVVGDMGPKTHQSLEASIMDLADDVAYSIHDVEDFFVSGIVDVPKTLTALAQAAGYYQHDLEVSGENPFVIAADSLKKSAQFDRDAYGHALNYQLNTLGLAADPASSPSTEAYRLQLKAILSKQVAGYFSALETGEFPDGHLLRLKRDAWHRMQVLKAITRQYLVLTPKMGLMQQSQAKAMEQLFTGLESWLLSVGNWRPLPEVLTVLLEDADAKKPEPDKYLPALDEAHYRAICDYICQMSDSDALRQSQWLTGTEIPGLSAIATTH